MILTLIDLSVAVSAANTHDSAGLKSLVMATPTFASSEPRRRKPAKLDADKRTTNLICVSRFEWRA